MITIYVRAIVPSDGHYVLMGDKDKEGKQIWDLPGGELVAGVDVKHLLRKLVLQNTGYSIVNLKFFEVTCKVKPRGRGQEPVTIIDFIFTSSVEANELQPAAKELDMLRFEEFEWLKSGGRFRENKVMALLSRYHRKHLKDEEARLQIETETATA